MDKWVTLNSSRANFHIRAVIRYIAPDCAVYDVVTNCGSSRFIPMNGDQLPKMVLDFMAEHEHCLIKYSPSVSVFFDEIPMQPMPRASVTSKYWTLLHWDDKPEEFPKLLELIKNLGLHAAVSPRHDQDIHDHSDVGELKKAHYHIAVVFPNPVGRRAVVDGITKNFEGTQDYVQCILNPAKMIDYMTHENQPEKHHYSKDDITWLNGATIEDFPNEFQLNKKERREQEEIQNLMELLQIIDTVAPKSIKDLSRWCVENNRPDLLRLIFKNSYYFDRVLKTVSTPDVE